MSRITTFLVTVISLTAFVALDAARPAAPATAENPSHSPKEPEQPDPAKRLTPDDIEALESIRRVLGTSLLQSPLWNHGRDRVQDQLEQEFASQLQEQFGIVPRKRAKSVSAAPVDRLNRPYYERSLVSLSRRLDAIAHDMDDLGLYDEADRARELGKHVRQKARQ